MKRENPPVPGHKAIQIKHELEGIGGHMTPEQRSLARHALGLTRQKISYRNHFVTGPSATDHPAWMQMVANGLAWRRPGSELTGGDDLFGLTEQGARAALDQGEKLCPEDFPNQSN